MSRTLNGKLPIDIAAGILEDILSHPLTDDQALAVVGMLLSFDKQDSAEPDSPAELYKHGNDIQPYTKAELDWPPAPELDPEAFKGLE